MENISIKEVSFSNTSQNGLEFTSQSTVECSLNGRVKVWKWGNFFRKKEKVRREIYLGLWDKESAGLAGCAVRDFNVLPPWDAAYWTIWTPLFPRPSTGDDSLFSLQRELGHEQNKKKTLQSVLCVWPWSLLTHLPQATSFE